MTNPLLGKVKLPGRVFALPSLGVFYGPGVLSDSVKDGEVHVAPMSALMEMKIRSADLLYSGKILRELCAECAPEILNPGKLVSQDVDALFVFLRVATYGPTMQLPAQHTCKDAKSHQYEFNIEGLIASPNNTVLRHKETLYRSVLSNGQVINLRPNTYEDSLRITHARMELDRIEDRKPSDDELERIAIDDMLNVIESVQNDAEAPPISDRLQLTQWIRAISKQLFREVMEALGRTEGWGYNYDLKLACKDCGETFEHALDLNPISFFYG